MMNKEITIDEMRYRLRKYAHVAKMYSRLAWKAKRRGEHSGKWYSLARQNMKRARQWAKDIEAMLA